MPSDSAEPAPDRRRGAGTLARLLDPVLGFLVWAVHFLVIYCANALACARGIGAASWGQQAGFRALLVLATLAALAVVIAHAIRTWRSRDPDQQFLAELTVGNGAVGAFGIAMQLFPLLLLHLCR